MVCFGGLLSAKAQARDVQLLTLMVEPSISHSDQATESYDLGLCKLQSSVVGSKQPSTAGL